MKKGIKEKEEQKKISREKESQSTFIEFILLLATAFIRLIV